MNSGNRIILNTAVTYVSLLLRLVIGLFSVRLVLQALGEESYGVYVIVGGIVALLDILNSNMSNTSMRYLAYSLGSKNKEDIYVTFNTTVFIHYLIGFFSILVLELGGYFMFEYIVNIPLDRMSDAKIIYQFMIITAFINVISVPYDAVTNAHENIWMLSVFDIINVILNFGLALLLLVYDGNRLIMYGFCLLLIQLLMRIAKVVYARFMFEECRQINKKFIERKCMKDILSFTGWNLFGCIAALGVTQLRSLILNIFFGVRLNAAEGVTRQVSTPLNMIVTSMTRAINPQIMKSEGGQNHDRMKFIVVMGSKYSSFLFAVLGIPVLIEIPYLLGVWLKDVPVYADMFCQLSILAMLIEKFTFQIVHAVSAVGQIRNFQIAGAIVNIIYLPIAWLLFKLGYPPVTIYILSLFSILLMAIVRFHYGRTVAGINTWNYIKTAILPVIWPLLIATLLAVVIHNVIANGFVNVVAVFLVFCLSFPVLFWYIGMDKLEQERWKGIFVQMENRILHKN